MKHRLLKLKMMVETELDSVQPSIIKDKKFSTQVSSPEPISSHFEKRQHSSQERLEKSSERQSQQLSSHLSAYEKKKQRELQEKRERRNRSKQKTREVAFSCRSSIFNSNNTDESVEREIQDEMD